MSYTEPKVTIDLKEYNDLKKLEADSKVAVGDITDEELSDVIKILLEDAVSPRNAIENVGRYTGLQIWEQSGAEGLKFKLRKPKG